mgnify:CR=1 FL=1
MFLVQLCFQTADFALRQSGVLQGDALGLGCANVALRGGGAGGLAGGLGLAAVGTGIGLIIAYFCKDSDAVSEYDCTEDMEEEDFDLDNDLKPVSERGYVHLNKAASDTADTEKEPSQETQTTDTESEE